MAMRLSGARTAAVLSATAAALLVSVGPASAAPTAAPELPCGISNQQDGYGVRNCNLSQWREFTAFNRVKGQREYRCAPPHYEVTFYYHTWNRPAWTGQPC